MEKTKAAAKVEDALSSALGKTQPGPERGLSASLGDFTVSQTLRSGIVQSRTSFS